jgi:hypothetical protein
VWLRTRKRPDFWTEVHTRLDRAGFHQAGLHQASLMHVVRQLYDWEAEGSA